MGNAEYMGPVSTTPDTMHLMILVSLAAAAAAAPQIVPYEHVEIEAEPYIHEEIEAEPYVHIEPELTPEALGVITRNIQAAPVAAPVQFAAPAVQQQFVPAQVVPQQFAAAPVAAGVWSGTRLNNLGQGVACRAVEEPQAAAPVVAETRQVVPQQFVPQQQFFAQQQFLPQQQFFAQQQFLPQQFAAPAVQARFNGACVNSLGAAVPCSQ